MLEMRETCERCGAKLGLDTQAMICSYECTFCLECSKEMAQICPNCSDELVVRPIRTDRAAGEPGELAPH
jgi:hypothetical protein